MVRLQLSGAPTPIQTYRQDLPGWCQAIVDRAIARVVDDRFPTAESFRSTLNAAISEATEATGTYSVVDEAGSAHPEDLTIATPVPLTVAAPIPFGDAPTVATWTPASATAATEVAAQPATPTVTLSTPPVAPSPTGTTLVLKRNQFAVVGGLLGALVLGVIVLAVVALRRPATVIMAPAQTAATNAPATSAGPAASSTAPAADPAPASAAASGTPASATATTPTPPPLEIAPPPLLLPPAAAPAKAPAKPASAPAAPATSDTPAAAAPARAIVVTTPFRFDARAVVIDGDKRRERDAIVVVADGIVTVTAKEKNGKALYSVPIDEVVGVTYSNSKQPLWNSPNGPAEAMKVDRAPLAFSKAGEIGSGCRRRILSLSFGWTMTRSGA